MKTKNAPLRSAFNFALFIISPKSLSGFFEPPVQELCP